MTNEFALYPFPLPANEGARIELLRQLHLVGTPPEPVLDRVTELAATLCHTPFACLTLLDEERLWLKSGYGVDVRELPREASFCTYTIMGEEPFVVPDTKADTRFTRNPLVKDPPFVRFYAGAPLRVTGLAIGTLCVLDTKPRQLDEMQTSGLSTLAQQVSRGMELAHQAAQNEERLRALIAACPLAIVGLDLSGRVTVWNESAQQMFGWAEQYALGRFNPVVGTEHTTEGIRLLQRMARGESLQHQEVQRRRRDGTLLWVSISSAPLRDSSGHVSGAVVLYEDITAHRSMEEQLRRWQKLEAIGQLAGGVAHNFNNHLTVIRGYSELLQRELSQPDSLGKLEQIIRATERASALTSQLLAFSRQQVVEPRIFDLNVLALEFGRSLPEVLGEEIRLTVVPSPQEAIVYSDPGQMEQVLLNLALNARDAMPQGGEFRIEIDTSELDAAAAHQMGFGAGGAFVTLTASDTGSGIVPDALPYIFDPFFTTKEPGKGTGLGLSTVHGIVTQSGGRIAVDSQVGGGTAFRIYLPLAKQRVTTLAVLRDDAWRGSETLLLVQEEPALASLVADTLRGRGYEVIVAKDAEDALISLTPGSGKRIDALLTDLMMPGMNGSELSEHARKVQPELKVLLMSGYVNDVLVGDESSRKRTDYLQKPFSMSELSRKLREMLDRK